MGHESPAARHLELVDLDGMLDRVTARIAPAWPLDRFIAVNPLWGFVDRPVTEVAATLAASCGARLTMPRSWYRAQWDAGRFGPADIAVALRHHRSPATVEEVVAVMLTDAPPRPRRARVTDVLDAAWVPDRSRSIAGHVVDDLSRLCAAWFDQGQATVGPARVGGLYATWRHTASLDMAPALLGRSGLRAALGRLPPDPRELFPAALDALQVPPHDRESYLLALLLDLSGWASFAAYLRFTARQQGSDDDSVLQLLAARLGWEWALLSAGGAPIAAAWQEAMSEWPAIDEAAASTQAMDWVLQTALETSYHQGLASGLETALDDVTEETPSVQAAFCIDVRSEVLRRALETESPAVATLGFAGFFGLPAEYRAIGATEGVPRLPGLLWPQVRVTDTGVPDALAARRLRRIDARATWKRFKHAALSGFSFVEAVGLLYGPKLVGDAFGLTRPAADPERAGLTHAEHALRKPRLTGLASGEPLELNARADLAAGILRGMSLTRGFARLIALVGHGSQTVNNPHGAGLDCGACCGQRGDVSARAVAALLDEPEVRVALRARGIDVPDTTWFVPALHDTTTDEVTLLDLDEVPPTHTDDVAALRAWFDGASARVRAERAPHLALHGLGPAELRQALVSRARDGSQVRPEWGLAGNAAFVVAPRHRTRHLDLRGRSFLHEYRWEDDESGVVLENILTAPMLVTHWINFQYYASTVDNVRFGSGNKVLHNVVGGGIGVLEGTAGDLRTGLPMQSLHDGERWVHEPIRLGVFVEAPRERVDAILARHGTVRDLVAHGWLHLHVLDPAEGACRRVAA